MKNKILISIASLLLLAGMYASAKTIIMKVNLKDGNTRYLNTEVVDEFNFTEIDEISEGPQQSFTVSFEYEKAWYHEDLGLAPDFKAVVIEEALPNGVNSTITYTLKSKGNFTNDIVMVQEGENRARISRQNTGYIHPQYGEIWVADQRTYTEEVLGQTYSGDNYPTPEELACVYYAPKYADGKTFAVYATDKILPRQYTLATLSYGRVQKFEEDDPTVKVRITFNNKHVRPINVEGVYGYAQQYEQIEDGLVQTLPEWLTLVEDLNAKFDKGEYNFSLKGNDTELVFDVPNDDLCSIYFKYTYRDAEDNEGITAGTSIDIIPVLNIKGLVDDPGSDDDEWFEKNFESIGYADYTDVFVSTLYSADACTWEVEVLKSRTTPGLYCLYNPYKAWPYAEYGDYILPGNHYIMINAEDPDFVYIPKSNTGVCINSYDGEIIAYSRAAYALDEGSSKEDAKDYAGSLKDGVIYFPENSLLVTIESYGNKFYILPGQLSIDLNNLVSSAKVKAQKAPAVRSIGESATSTATERIVLVKDAKLMSKDELLKF
ncbi:MAG: hypothetical protein HDS65_02340 [Bacteroidales bacterium]|nr:hypothetical protein [Bacteroidales bacterium]